MPCLEWLSLKSGTVGIQRANAMDETDRRCTHGPMVKARNVNLWLRSRVELTRKARSSRTLHGLRRRTYSAGGVKQRMGQRFSTAALHPSSACPETDWSGQYALGPRFPLEPSTTVRPGP